jgi:hypothetical protein
MFAHAGETVSRPCPMPRRHGLPPRARQDRRFSHKRYGEDLNDARTPLAAFFSSLLDRNQSRARVRHLAAPPDFINSSRWTANVR